MEKIFHTPKNFYKHIFKSNYTVPVKRFKAISKAKKDRLPFLTVMTDAGMSVSVQSCWWTAWYFDGLWTKELKLLLGCFVQHLCMLVVHSLFYFRFLSAFFVRHTSDITRVCQTAAMHLTVPFLGAIVCESDPAICWHHRLDPVYNTKQSKFLRPCKPENGNEISFSKLSWRRNGTPLGRLFTAVMHQFV